MQMRYYLNKIYNNYTISYKDIRIGISQLLIHIIALLR